MTAPPSPLSLPLPMLLSLTSKASKRLGRRGSSPQQRRPGGPFLVGAGYNAVRY